HTVVPFCANTYSMKLLGEERIISSSTFGSLQERYAPMDIVIPDQFFDRTRGRVSTFFGEGLVAHIAFAHPVCQTLGGVVAAAGESAGVKIHHGGSHLFVEGPALSPRAPS